MLKQLKVLFFGILLGLITSGCGGIQSNNNNQKASGSIQYDIQMRLKGESVSGMMKSMKGMMDTSTMTYYWKKNSSRNDLKMAGTKTTFIENKDSAVFLMTTIRQDSIASEVITTKQMQKLKGLSVKSVNKTGEEKEILGFKTQKVVFQTEKGKLTFWTTDKIDASKASFQFSLEKLEGFPLLIRKQSARGMTIEFKAIEFSRKEPEMAMFDLTIPEGYQVLPYDQLMENRKLLGN